MTAYGRQRIPGPIDAAAISVETDPPEVGWHAAWWAADVSLGDGDAVSTWNDRTGNGRDLTQATSGRYPLFRPTVSSLNNKAAVEFDGTDDYLRWTSGSGLSQPFTYVLVMRIHTAQSGQVVYMDSGSSGTPAALFKFNAATDWVLFAGSSFAAAASPAIGVGNFAVRAMTNGASCRFNINGTATSPAQNAGANQLYGVTLGAHRDNSSAAAISVAFAAVYPGDVTADAKWAAFKTWVSDKYGMTLA